MFDFYTALEKKTPPKNPEVSSQSDETGNGTDLREKVTQSQRLGHEAPHIRMLFQNGGGSKKSASFGLQRRLCECC